MPLPRPLLSAALLGLAIAAPAGGQAGAAPRAPEPPSGYRYHHARHFAVAAPLFWEVEPVGTGLQGGTGSVSFSLYVWDTAPGSAPRAGQPWSDAATLGATLATLLG